MNYSIYRSNIKPGDILAWSHRGWRSLYDFKIQMVRLFTRSEYSHVGIAWAVGSRVFVIEAVEPRARIYPLSKLGDFYHIGMGADWGDHAEEHALQCVGAEYKQLQAVRAFFEPLEPGSLAECAALVIDVAHHYGVDLGTRATPDAVVQSALELGKYLCFVKGNK